MKVYLSRHLQVLFATLGDMRRTSMTSFSTILVIAITLSLPCMLYVVIKSANQLSDDWQGRPQISIFFQSDISENEARLIYEELGLHPAIELAEFITPNQAIEEFRTLSGIDFELDFLDENPLPASVVIMPNIEQLGSKSLLQLKDELSAIDGIDNIKLDLEWTDRFSAILSAATRISSLLSGLLAITLLLIVSNTIKLLILNRRQEIEITKLVGASNAFVRRPFLYYGLLFGFFGAVVCLLLLAIAKEFITDPLATLANLYHKNTLLYELNTIDILAIISIGSLLGWVAARWSVAQHLWKIKPH